MGETYLLPFADAADWLLRYCKLPLHTGFGTVERHGNSDHPFAQKVRRMQWLAGQIEPEPVKPEFEADFFVPAAGNCLVFLRWPGESQLSRDFGQGLTVDGDSPDGRFRLTCPQYYVKAASPRKEEPGWAIASINEPATVSYGDARPIATVTATINNFDFEYGNQNGIDGWEQSKVLRVEAAGRPIDFEWRKDRIQLRRLVDAGVIGTTSFVTFSFPAWPDALRTRS